MIIFDDLEIIRKLPKSLETSEVWKVFGQVSLHTLVVEGYAHFSHSLCMHMIVVTSDDKVLIVKRSEKVMQCPGLWSCSVEEQLAPQDLQGGVSGTLLKCGRRLLLEELGLSNEAYNEENLRVLSVFLEGDILAVALCAHVVIDIDSSILGRILSGLPRIDYEFTEWAFLEHKELLDELFHPTREYHPSAGYRMLLALIRRYGEPRVAKEFFRDS